MVLSIDIETYSSNDLLKCGVYKYVEADDFEVMLIGVGMISEHNRSVATYEAKDLPDEILDLLKDDTVLKTAYNAQFERVCLNRFLGLNMPPEAWECTMVRAAYFGYPFGLDAVAKAMSLDVQKDTSGRALIRYFSIPCKPTKANGMRTRNLPAHDPDKWARFIAYCTQDVKVEMEIRDRLEGFELPEKEKNLYCLDQQINDRGLLLDLDFVQKAIILSDLHTGDLLKEASRLTDLDNPNSATQLKSWLSEELGREVTTLTKGDLPELAEEADCDTVKRVIEIRSELAKTSVKKYDAMINAICEDRRVRGLLQFYGANRTGRWAGRLVQVQNLPQNHMSNLVTAREVVRAGDIDLARMFFDDIPNTLSQLIRTAFIPKKGHSYAIIDFSAIEARVIAWLAGEKWRLEVFASHGKIYEASASQMFGIPIEEITKESDLRQKGKVAELALGYQGGPGALVSMGALNMGLTEDELPGIVNAWRRANPYIVRLWKNLQDAAIEVIKSPGSRIRVANKINLCAKNNYLTITLPSGRDLYYPNPYLTKDAFGDAIRYKGINQTTKKWESIDTYGGKLTENVVQAIARDCLAEALLRLDALGYSIVMHVHDEIVLEHPDGFDIESFEEVMSSELEWAPDLDLRADGFISKFYKK